MAIATVTAARKVHTVSWFGFSVTVPTDWNVTLQQGDARAGVLALSDLRAVRLEVRWNTFSARRIGRHHDRLLAKLKKRLAATAVAAALPATRLSSDDTTIILLQAPTRLYELSFPPSGGREGDDAAVLAAFCDHSADATWPWQLYGAVGTAPARYRLKRAALFPGNVRLDFVAPRLGQARISLGAWSLADRLLADRSLAEWARTNIPLVRNHPGGTLETPSAGVLTFARQTRNLLRRPRVQHLTLTHDTDANTLRWVETYAPPT